MVVNERPQRGFKTVQPTLHLTDGLSEIAQAPPFGTGWRVHRRREAKASGEGTEVVRRCEGSGQGHPVLIEVEVDEEETQPLDETGTLQVGCDADFVHRPLKVLNAPVKVAGRVGHALLCEKERCFVQQGQVLSLWRWKAVVRGRDGGRGVVKSLEQAFGFWREPTRSDRVQPLCGRSDAAATVPHEEVHLDAVVVHDGGRMPLHHKPHTTSCGPTIMTLRDAEQMLRIGML